jgi:hypothetical protein
MGVIFKCAHAILDNYSTMGVPAVVYDAVAGATASSLYTRAETARTIGE